MAKFNEYHWYVYVLVDPRNGQPFYVGKGTGDRMRHHEKMVRRGLVDNAIKCQRIREIIESGADIEYRVNAVFCDERDAYAHEADLIAELAEHLTNATHGRLNSDARERERAKLLLSRVVPFDRWKASHKPTPKDADLYWFVVNGLKTVSCHGAH